jgi:hypothetical protein
VDVTSVPERQLTVRLVTDEPRVPTREATGSPDTRTLGVFVHAVRLRTDAQAR